MRYAPRMTLQANVAQPRSLAASSDLARVQRSQESSASWYKLANVSEVPSPALLIYPDRVEENLRNMIQRAGGVSRLRPHVKTHKLPQIIRLKLEAGITKFKAATIAEAEMTAAAGGTDVLLAYQPVGPNARRFVELIRKFPGTRFSTLVDNPATLIEIATAAQTAGVTAEVLIDLNVGMNRTGIAPGAEATALYRTLAATPGLKPAGLHAYDGHLHQALESERASAVAAAFAPVWKMRDELRSAGVPVPRIIASGTPTFALLAREPEIEVGAGTSVLWDANESRYCPEFDFLEAAVLLSRVISRPTPTRITLDLGHKAVASEMPHPRVRLFGLEDAQFVMHSEEHLVLESSRAIDYPVGTVVYGVPSHVCPTVALYSEVSVVRDSRVVETWPVVARARRLSI